MLSASHPVRWTGRQAVMTLPEQIDVSNAGQIREELQSAINRGAKSLIADMTATVSCDYSGADAVVRTYQRAILSGTELRLVVTAQLVRRVLTISGLDRLVAIYPSLESATTALAPKVGLPTRPAERPADDQVPPDIAGPLARPLRATGPAYDIGMAIGPAVIRQMLDAFQVGVALTDEHGVIALANTRLEAIFGYQRGELPGHYVESLIPADLQDTDRSLRARYDRARRTRPIGAGARLVGLRKDGTTFPAEISLSPVRTAAGKFTLAVIHDVTEAGWPDDVADLATGPMRAQQEHRGRELLDTVVTTLFHVGLSLQAAINLPADAARWRVTEALGHLDNIISQIRDSAFTSGPNCQTPPE